MKLSAELAARAPGSMPCHLRVIFNNGDVIEQECLYPPGHSFPDSGLDREVVETKFRHCAESYLSASQCDELIAALLDGNHDQSFNSIMQKIAQAQA
jgi:2-methylcitrate dehydratase